MIRASSHGGVRVKKLAKYTNKGAYRGKIIQDIYLKL